MVSLYCIIILSPAPPEKWKSTACLEHIAAALLVLVDTVLMEKQEAGQIESISVLKNNVQT